MNTCETEGHKADQHIPHYLQTQRLWRRIEADLARQDAELPRFPVKRLHPDSAEAAAYTDET